MRTPRLALQPACYREILIRIASVRVPELASIDIEISGRMSEANLDSPIEIESDWLLVRA